MVDAGVNWSEVEALVRRRDRERLVAVLRDLDGAQRKALVAPLRTAVRPSGPEGWPPWDDFPMYAVVGAGVLPDARSVVSWLRRFGGLGEGYGQGHRERCVEYAASVAQVLVDRAPSWLPGSVPLLADQLAYDASDPWGYFLVESLRAHLDLDPPRAPDFVRGWVVEAWRDTPLSDLLRRDLRFVALAPLALEQDGLAAGFLAEWSRPGWLDRLTEAVDDGLVEREAVLDHLLGRLERGGRPAATDRFVKVHDALAPTLDEVAARIGTYVTMLGDPARSTVAGTAQAQLFRLDDAGRLPVERLQDASQLVLLRKEKKLVRAQLVRLKETVRREPALLDALAVAAAAGLANPAGDLQAATVKLVGEWWPGLGDAARRTVTERAAGLPISPRSWGATSTRRPSRPTRPGSRRSSRPAGWRRWRTRPSWPPSCAGCGSRYGATATPRSTGSCSSGWWRRCPGSSPPTLQPSDRWDGQPWRTRPTRCSSVPRSGTGRWTRTTAWSPSWPPASATRRTRPGTSPRGCRRREPCSPAASSTSRTPVEPTRPCAASACRAGATASSRPTTWSNGSRRPRSRGGSRTVPTSSRRSCASTWPAPMPRPSEPSAQLPAPPWRRGSRRAA